MPSVSDEEIEQKRQRVEKLREQIAEAEAKQAENVNSVQNEIDAVALDAEAARLEARLNQVKEASKVGFAREQAALPLQQQKEQLEAAQAQAQQPVGPVDTNPDDKNDEE